MGNESAGLDRLLTAVQELAMARGLDEVVEIVRLAARELTGADGATFVLRDGDMCFYVDENAISPLWRGQRFPLLTCISGWAMLNKDVAIIPDIYLDDRIPHDAYRPTFVKSLVMVPIRSLDPVGAIGNYWADEHTATDFEVRSLQALADATSVALAHVSIREELEAKVTLEQEARRLSGTDDLTGLLNRRGFWVGAEPRIATAHDVGQRPILAYLDLNGLKTLNDQHGHAAGDAAIVAVAEALRAVAGPDDLLARIGGDEFSAIFVASAGGLKELRQRLDAEINARHPAGAAIGLAEIGPEDQLSVDDLVARADALMYAEKRSSASRTTD